MSTIPFKGVVCWNENRITEVINTEALSIIPPEFLATHAPFKKIKYERMPSQQPNTSEETFLRELINQAEKDQHVFAVIQGIPGTGKSNLIRWLKEKYDQAVKTDVILLIERANSSLHKTITQIIDSDLFNAKELKDDLQRLKGAADQLSNEGLEDSILDNIRLATQEVQLPQNQLPSIEIAHNIENFLLDPNIREWLKREDGPIKRILRHISQGKDSGLSVDEAPSFTSADFDVPFSLLRTCRQAGINDLARQLTELLNDPEEETLRYDLALYLTRLLSFTIGHTMALSSETLKDMFHKLRRNLRAQGKNLTLFIEDITAFTGIDAGLIDVITTQHTGAGNQEFCRIISVIGITDSYYTDRFPSNFRERITHHLVLNETETNSESSLLKNTEDTADLVARYMNAMRVEGTELKKWFDQGGEIRSLPNHCFLCQYREACHSAFGSVDLVEDDHSERYKVGLYPFNQNAIWTMFNGIDTKKLSKTPRSLLRNVLQYVLQSHGRKIKTGEFPPAQNELGSDFKAPFLKELPQGRVIREKGGADAERIQTLVLFWGDCSINIGLQDGATTVEGLTEPVFNAFSVPMILGGAVIPPPINPTPVIPPIILPPPPPEVNKYADTLRTWLSGGLLDFYEDFARWLAEQVKAFYDWEAYGITRAQVTERVKAGRYAFERQHGRFSSPSITFECNHEMHDVLLALAEINTRLDRLNPGEIGSHLVTLGLWLRQQEDVIINIVKKPSVVNASVSLLELTFFDSLLCSILEGEINSDAPADLFRSMIKASRNNPNSMDLERKFEGYRNIAWTNLIKRLRSENIIQIRGLWLQLINHRQGKSDDVLFVDAAKVFDLVEKFQKLEWKLPVYDLPDNLNDTNWDLASRLYKDLQGYFKQTLETEKTTLDAGLKKLAGFLGEASMEEVFSSIRDTLDTLRSNQEAHWFQSRNDLNAIELMATQKMLAEINASKVYSKWVVGLSSSLDQIKKLKAYNDYFGDFVKEIQEKERNLQERAKGLMSSEEIDKAYQDIESLYEMVEGVLSATISADDKGEVIP